MPATAHKRQDITRGARRRSSRSTITATITSEEIRLMFSTPIKISETILINRSMSFLPCFVYHALYLVYLVLRQPFSG